MEMKTSSESLIEAKLPLEGSSKKEVGEERSL